MDFNREGEKTRKKMSIVDFKSDERIPLVIGEDEHWTPYENPEEFLPLINPINYEFQVSPYSTTVKKRPISCFTDSLLLKVEDKHWREDWAVFYFLYSKDSYFQIGSINDHISSINTSAALNIKKHTALDYLKLFSYFYAIDENYGSFFVIEGLGSEFIDLVPYSNELEKTRNRGKLTPPVVKEPDQKGNISVECDVVVGSSLFRGKFKISKTGEVELVEDKIIIEGYDEAPYEDDDDF